MTEVCNECKTNISNNDNAVSCDSCYRPFHKKPCSGLNASEVRVMEIKGPRQLRFFCKDCQKGLSQVPALIKAVEELRQEVEALKTASVLSAAASNGDMARQAVAPSNEHEVLYELQERQKRATSLMLFNVPEGDDLVEAKRILAILSDDPPDIHHISRVGKTNKNNARALKLTLGSPDDVRRMVRNGHKLKGSKIYVNLDLTAKQRDLDKTLAVELKARKDKGENVAIRYRNGTPHIVQKKN